MTPAAAKTIELQWEGMLHLIHDSQCCQDFCNQASARQCSRLIGEQWEKLPRLSATVALFRSYLCTISALLLQNRHA